MSWTKETAALPGSDALTMGDQMRAASKSPGLEMSAADGSISSPRREFLKNAIQYRANQATRRESTPGKPIKAQLK
jgi:hypothetical protein